MAGAGIEVTLDKEYQEILDALSKASMPDLKAIAAFAGKELSDITQSAFTAEADPVTGEKWVPLKHPRADGHSTPVLRDHGGLHRSLIENYEAFPDGSVIFGSNMVYARIHQQGGSAGRGHRSLIPARPYMGVPQDFDRRILNDPAILEKLGMALGG
jgi:phage virion morphogenesis protein